MKNRRFLSFLLAFAMLITLLTPLTVVTASADATLITNQAGLAALSSNLSGNYKLANDITISGTWEGISSTATISNKTEIVGFTGTLDGDGHTITFANGTTIVGGLFKQLATDNDGHSAVVKNLNIVQAGSATYTPVTPGGSGAYCAGVLAASIEYPYDCNNTAITAAAANTVKIQNVNVTANVTSITTKDNNKGYAVGGIIGETGMITLVENCTFNGSISDSSRTNTDNGKYTSGYGGIVGVLIRNGGTLTVRQCINNASITGYASEGGILGHAREWSGGATAPAALTIEKCINNGTITGMASNNKASVGGIAGYVYAKDAATAIIRYCINTGKIASAFENYSAGIVGALRRKGTNFQFIGSLQEADSIVGAQIAQERDGSEALLYENNYGRGTGIAGYYSSLASTAEYAAAYNTLNAAYPNVYALANNKVTLKWLITDVDLITDQAGLAAISSNLSGNYKLANDITISGTWEGISSTATISNKTEIVGFTGTLDGDGHTITFANGTTIVGGLFKQLATDNDGHSAVVKNLNIVQAGSATYTPVTPGGSGAYCAGVLAASIEYPYDCNNTAITAAAANTVKIQNVNVTANVTSITTKDNNKGYAVGGIIGETGMITLVENCTFNGSISDSSRTHTDNNKYTSGYGGIVGVLIRNGGTLTVRQCINNADITGYASEGGILGHAREWGGGETAPAALTIEKCINNGIIYCSANDSKSFVGGITGYVYAKNAATAIIRYCINNGGVGKKGDSTKSGGIVADMRRNGTNFQLIGNLQESDSVAGNQISTTSHGSGGVWTNNYTYAVADGQATVANNASTYAAAYNTLNAAYPNVYSFANNKVTLTWALTNQEAGNDEPTGSLANNQVSNQADFEEMPATGTYTLTKDITITKDWKPTKQFKGTFDGAGHTITFADGITVYGGLFQQLNQGAVVKNLNIVAGSGVTWKPVANLPGSGSPCVGGVAASAEAGTVDGVNKWGDTAFVTNSANKIQILNVTVSARIAINGSTGGDDKVAAGGIVGEIGIISLIKNCVFSGTVSDGTRSKLDMVGYESGYGGIVGVAIRNAGPVEIVECINNGNISGYGQQGGILGYSRAWGSGGTGLESLKIEKCINNGTITSNRTETVNATHYSTAGGISGYIYVKDSGTATLLNNVNNGIVITKIADPEPERSDNLHPTYAGGIVGILRRGAANSFTIRGNATRYGAARAGDITGGKYWGKPDGSGDLVEEYNVAFGATPSGVAAGWASLNEVYSNVFTITKDNKLSLKWVNDKCAYLDQSNYQKLFSLALDGIIQLRVGVAIPGDIPTSLRLIVSKGIIELENVQMTAAYDSESGYYVVSVPILAKEMADAKTYTITVQNNGVTIWSAEQTISVKSYVTALKTHSEYSAWFDLADAMLKYGAAAQALFNYNTSAPAADISGGITVDTASLPSHTVTGDRSFLTQIRGSLSLEERTDLNFYFQPKNASANLTVTVQKGGNAVTNGVVKEWVSGVNDNGVAQHVYYAVRIQNLAADELDDWYEITVTDGSKTVTITYSGLCWAKAVLNDSSATAATKTLARGIALYANKAIASVNNSEPLVIANANSASAYYISYTSGADAYLKSAIFSYAKRMSQKGIFIETSLGSKTGGKSIAVTTDSSITGFKITFDANGNITVKGKDNLMANNGFHYLVDKMITKTSSGSYIIANPTTVTDSATAYTRSGWKLAAPAYDNGTLASALYNDGTGLATDGGVTWNAERSYAMYIRSTNATQFSAYETKLQNNGYTRDAYSSTAAKSNGSNLSRTYYRGTQILYLYFDAVNSVTRVIDDQASTLESEFEYTFSYTTSTSTDLILYGMKYNTKGLYMTDTGGDSTIANNGALIIIKQADGSVMLIDGGLYLQATDTAIEGLWNYLHTITGKSANEAITISCWYVTHPHGDHYYMVHALLEKYHEKLDLQRVMYNFPQYMEDIGYVEEIRTTAMAYYPNLKFMKCHTGQSIKLGSLTLDVLATHEDLVNATYGTVSFAGGNDMTTILRITFADGSRYISTGDAPTEDDDDTTDIISRMISRYAASELTCKFFEVSHHGYNELTQTQCNAFKPQYVFFPNASYGDFPSSGTYAWRRRHCSNNYSRLKSAGGGAVDGTIFFAGSATYRLTITNGSVSKTETAIVP